MELWKRTASALRRVWSKLSHRPKHPEKIVSAAEIQPGDTVPRSTGGCGLTQALAEAGAQVVAVEIVEPGSHIGGISSISTSAYCPWRALQIL